MKRQITPPGVHCVEAGECLVTLIAMYSVPDFDTIVKDPHNAMLFDPKLGPKSHRTPFVLQEGDRVYIPLPKDKRETRNTDKRHPFAVPSTQTKLRIRLRDSFGGPLKNRKCLLKLEGSAAQKPATSNDDGEIVFEEIPIDAKKAVLTLVNAPKGLPGHANCLECQFTLAIGSLPPVNGDAGSGMTARLNNLGLYGDSGQRAIERGQTSDFNKREKPLLTFRAVPEPGAGDWKHAPTELQIEKEHGC